MRKLRPKVIIAMSGGVDSSVTAALLKYGGFSAGGARLPCLTGRQADEQGPASGWDIRGVHIKMWSDPLIPCTTKEDRLDAMRVAAHLDIPFETWDLTAEYRQAVVEYMVREYAAGRTPNPDVMCNRYIKFGIFLKKALEAGADFVATGHYVRLAVSGERLGSGQLNAKRYTLYAAHDANKDQSYFLWTLTQEQLKHCLFPLGGYPKPQVRELARKFGLPTAEKPDSQGICFIGEINIREFLKNYIPIERGPVLTSSGRKVGEHQGLAFYTIGQREGLGTGGGGIPYYVAAKDFSRNALVVAEGPYDEKLFSRELMVGDLSWISGKEPELPLKCEARIRYRQPLQPCEVCRFNELNEFNQLTQAKRNSLNSKTHQLRVVFDNEQRAITPGQSVVFYKGEEMLGGGVIQ